MFACFLNSLFEAFIALTSLLNSLLLSLILLIILSAILTRVSGLLVTIFYNTVAFAFLNHLILTS